MKRKFAILFALTALTVGLGLPAWSAMHAGSRLKDARENIVGNTGGEAASPVLVSGKEADLDHGRSLRRDGDDDEEDEDGDEGGAAAGPAPAGTDTLPNNGLFGSGTAPTVKVN